MAFAKHNCIEKKCSGPKYCGMKIECHKCQKHTYIECIDKSSEIEHLLAVLEITVHDGVKDKSKYVTEYGKNLNKIFNGQSIKFE